LAHLFESYSTRQLTNEADTLDAFLGVMNYIRQLRTNAGSLCGLPVLKTSGDMTHITLIDSLEGIITAALSWHSGEDNNNSHERQHLIPFWTWTGWTGRAKFWVRSIREGRHEPFIRQVQLETSSSNTVASSALYRDNTVNQSELDTVTLIQFETPMVPDGSFTIMEEQFIDSDSNDTIGEVEALKFRVCGRPSFCNRILDIYTFDELIENIRTGTWSC
jgi:hypothetical protein